MMIQSTLLVTSECSQKQISPIYQQTFLEGRRLIGRYNLVCVEQKG